MVSMSHSKFLHTNPSQLKLLYQLSTDWTLRKSTWRGGRRCLLSIALFPQSCKSDDWLIRNIWTIWRRCLISLVCFCGFAWSKLPSSHDVNEVGGMKRRCVWHLDQHEGSTVWFWTKSESVWWMVLWNTVRLSQLLIVIPYAAPRKMIDWARWVYCND